MREEKKLVKKKKGNLKKKSDKRNVEHLENSKKNPTGKNGECGALPKYDNSIGKVHKNGW